MKIFTRTKCSFMLIFPLLMLFALSSCLDHTEASPFLIHDRETWWDENQSRVILREEAEAIRPGMTLEEVVAQIGKPRTTVGSGIMYLLWEIKGGSYLKLDIRNSYSASTAKTYGDETCTLESFLEYVAFVYIVPESEVVLP